MGVVRQREQLLTKMPGHIKLVKGAVDPDPTEFLLPSLEMKRADQSKVYDPKKSVWIPDAKTHGYKEGLLESGDLEDPASKCLVAVGHEKFTFKAAEVGKVNPPKFKKLLEAQCKDTGARADEAEVNALKGGRKAMIKMETRIRELESELDAETRRNNDVLKNLRKAERSIKELTFAGDEDKKNHERMQALIDQLQGKVKSYKKQIEEAEEIAALNLAKYRKVAGALGDAAAAADAAEQEAAMRKARARSASLV